MESQIQLEDITVDVVLKNIKNLRLTVHPPAGRVRISAPKRTSMKTIRAFAVSKLEWIRKQQVKVREQERETPLEYVDGESHYAWGNRCLLRVSESEEPPSVGLESGSLRLQVRPGTDREKRQTVVEDWYREQVKTAVPPLLARWEPRLGVRVERFHVRQMKTRWGSCNPKARTIRLNSELARKPPELLEYLVVHELVHLLEPTHNARFYALMDRYMPDWKVHRRTLDRRPVRREA